ncbi:MAG: diguanylate cyclase [Rubrivivax sp.]|nr:diguanylate cyclase [Rubrivivax sp.]
MLDEPPLAPQLQAALQPVLAALLPPVLRRHGEMLAVKDLRSGRYVHANAAMAAFVQRPLVALLDCTDAELFEPAVATVLRAAEQTALAHGEALTSEHRFDHGGSRHEFSVLRWATPPDAGGARWLCSVWRDLGPERQREAQLRAALEQIEQQQQANELLQRELADQALRDPASGLYRRAHFEDQLRREVDLSTREHREFAIVFIEIDPLAPKVLALGAQGEQRVFEAVGRLLRGGTRAMDASCRYDGHRFAVLLSGVGLATAHARMEGLRRKCATQIVVHEGRELGFTVAMGVASFPHTAQTQDELVAACDAALAEARRRGGNHVTLAAIRFEPN